MSGIVFVKTPVFFEYHLKICDRFLDRVCYSDKNVFIIFLQRSAGSLCFLLLLTAGGVHPAALVLPMTSIAYRGYLFGGTLSILFSVYKASGAFVAFTLYLPVHLLLDVIFLSACVQTFSRAFSFRFCAADFHDLLREFICFGALVVLVCILEMILLGVLFHPIGNLL